MQRRSFLFALLMAVAMTVLCPQAMRAKVETVTVGEGTSAAYYVPYGNYYMNSTTQMLYTASEIGKKGKIQSIAFYVSDAYEFKCSELKIYMGETDLTQLSTSNAFNSTGMKLVYSDTDVTIGSATGWETMTLSTPFDYSGEKNLVVVVCRKSSSYTGFLEYRYSDGTSLYRWNDNNSNYGDIDNETAYNTNEGRADAQFQIKSSEHVMEHHEAVAPTATTTGNYEYWYCATHCQKYFKDEDGDEEFADGEWIIPAGACPHHLIEHAAVPKTCDDDGNTLYYECNVCHHYFSDANAENEVEENSWLIAADPSLHVFTNKYDSNGFGKCDRCGHSIYSIFEPATYYAKENCYYIYKAGQLYWFANKVNNGFTSDEGYPFNARVIGEIVVNSNVLTDEGELNGDGSNFLAWTPIINYKGTFDGYDCTIKGLYCVSANSSVGLFSNNYGTITRIYIEDSYFEGDNLVGGIVAYNEGTVENCSCHAIVKGNGNVGGLVGFNTGNGVVKNCYSRATVKAETTDATRSGNVVGYNEGTLLANCYYLSDVADQQETAHPTVISKTAEQFASGEVAWLLNGEKVDGTSVWGQFLGSDYAPAAAFPSPSMRNFVWKGYVCLDDSLQYANHYLHTEPNHDHVYDSGFCKACGSYFTPESQIIDGVLTFDIANYGNALYVTKYTNEGNTCAARLVAPVVTMASNDAYLTISNGSLTLDLNGDTLTTAHNQVILVNGGNLTIHDSSANGTGAVINTGSYGVNATSGSLTITGGTFIGNDDYAVMTSSSCNSLAISGGKYYVTGGTTCRLYTPDKSALAPGYEYVNLRTGEEIKDYTSQPIFAPQSGDTVIVKQASVKAVLTKNGEDINYYDFDSAFAAAQQCTADDNATLKLMKNRTMLSSDGYITFSSGTFTLDLNGDTISNYNSQTILVIGANLTITDSSEGQTGMIKNSGAFAVDAPSGSLIITGGTFIGSGGFAVQTSPSCTSLAISGGKYYVTSGTSRLNTPGKSALAPGYSYYNLRTGKELEDYTYQPIYVEQSTDTVIVKQASVKAVLTKGGEDTNYYDFNSAFEAAQQCTADDNATLKLMKNRTIPDGPNAYITLSSGTFTLDLNGDTIRNNNSYTLFVNGANLTITDSSEGQNGALINSNSHVVNVVSGSLTVLAGNLIARNTAPALYVGSPSPTVSLKGGKYMSNNTDGYRVYTYDKSLLAPGYSYYNLRTDEELNDVTSGWLAMSNTADTLIVKQGSVKAILTKGDEVTTYYSFNSAFAAAQQCTASDNATLKLMKNYTIPDGPNAYITLSGGTFTLDLNGDTIRNNNSYTLFVNGANLTITDSSEGQNGALINSYSYAVYIVGGSLTVLGGNFIARNTAPALYVGSPSPTVSLKGGKYMSNNTYGYRVYTYDKSLLAPGYSYYNLSTGEEMNDVTSGYISMSNTADTLIVKPGTVKAVLTRNGEGTNYSDFNAAFTAAQQCKANEKATLKLMQNYAIPDNKSYITLSSGVFTLDLNGDTISIYNAQTILVSGANLTITDSSEGQNGALINRASSAVNVTDGSLTVLGGNIISRASASALYVGSPSPTVLLKGGKYMSNSTEGYRVKASGKSLLAPGYSYYNLRTGEEMTDVTDGILSVTNTADTVVVKLGAVKVMLTKGDEVTTYKDINAAFAAAQQCTTSDNATLKLLQNVTLPNGDGYITLTDGAFTLDLNGDTLGIMGSWVLKLNGTDLTVTDSSEDKKGALVNTASIVVYAVNGSLTMESGNLKGKGQYSIYNNEEGMEITLLGGSYSGGIQYHANSTLNLPNVAMFNAEGNEVELNYVEYVDFNCYETEEPFTINAYYNIGDVKNKLTKVDDGYYTEHLTLVDGKSFVSKYDFTAGEVEYSRAMTSKWGTLCLPFALTIDEANQPYSLYNVNGVEDGSLTVTKCIGSVEAGVPVIVRRDNAATGITITAENVEVDAAAHDNGYGDLTLNGTFEGEKRNSGYYIANDKFWNAANYNGDVTIPPFRAYMTAGLLCAKSIAIFDPEEEMTGVTTVTADETDPDAWYTLGGVKLDSKPVKAGTYVHGGKKVVVK